MDLTNFGQFANSRRAPDIRQRALEAVAAVNEAVHLMQKNGGMKEINRAFKAARKVDRSMRYFDFLHARKAAMLEAIAKGGKA